MAVRFAQLTVYLAAMGVLFSALLGGSGELSATVRIILEIGGLSITLLFWVHQERTMAYWNHFVSHAAKLEEDLGFSQYRTRPKAGWLSSFKAMRLFFILLTLFWAASFILIS
jgi:hypothetical protein